MFYGYIDQQYQECGKQAEKSTTINMTLIWGCKALISRTGDKIAGLYFFGNCDWKVAKSCNVEVGRNAGLFAERGVDA